MLIKIVVIGRLKDRALQARCDEFAKWLGPYAKLEIRELPDSTVEREGKALVIRPSGPLRVGRTCDDARKLKALYEEGYARGRELMRWFSR